MIGKATGSRNRPTVKDLALLNAERDLERAAAAKKLRYLQELLDKEKSEKEALAQRVRRQEETLASISDSKASFDS
jgi:CHAD domain-containing protein